VEWAEGSSIEEQLLADLAQRGAHASCKTNFVMALLEKLGASGHRTLVFSQSRVMLDILEVCVWGGGGAGRSGCGCPAAPVACRP
jgi:SNF2 family DNA or RNA helicase